MTPPAFRCSRRDWREGWGADGDHLKTIADLEPALAAGMPMVTLDLSDQIVAAAAAWEDGEVSERFGDCDPAEQERIRSEYENQVFVVGESEVAVDGATARRVRGDVRRRAGFCGEGVSVSEVEAGKRF